MPVMISRILLCLLFSSVAVAENVMDPGPTYIQNTQSRVTTKKIRNQSPARAARRATINAAERDTSTRFTERSPSNEDAGDSGAGSSDLLSEIARAAESGAGRAGGPGMCGVAVKAIISKALRKNFSCIRWQVLPGHAVSMAQTLQSAGFVKGSCNVNGSIHVYSGTNKYGHVEVKTASGYYYGARPVSYSMKDSGSGRAGRRTLIGCFVPGDVENNSKIKKCGAGSGPGKKTGRNRYHNKRRAR